MMMEHVPLFKLVLVVYDLVNRNFVWDPTKECWFKYNQANWNPQIAGHIIKNPGINSFFAGNLHSWKYQQDSNNLKNKDQGFPIRSSVERDGTLIFRLGYVHCRSSFSPLAGFRSSVCNMRWKRLVITLFFFVEVLGGMSIPEVICMCIYIYAYV